MLIDQDQTSSMNTVLTDSIALNADTDGHFKLDKHGKVKVPRRLIHCSDGILEEYSTDEEEEEPPPPPVDTSKLTWASYFWHYAVRTAWGSLTVCDYLGEKLAYMFGITTPRFQYAISAMERMKEEEQEEREIEDEERAAEERIIQQALSAKNQKKHANTGDTKSYDKTEGGAGDSSVLT